MLVAGLTSCGDIFIDDLEDVNVTTYSPTENDSITSANITFQWDEFEIDEYDVTSYRIKVATPSFSNLDKIVLDTVITGEQFIIAAFEPGDYQWRIYAQNSVSETNDPTIYSFKVSTSTDLEEFKPILTSPTDGVGIVEGDPVNFRWNGHFGADYYVLNCKNITLNQMVIQNREIPVYNTSDPTDGRYDTTIVVTKDNNFEWWVRAVNTTSNSEFSEHETFSIDTVFAN